MSVSWGKAIVAGLVATLVMTAAGVWILPLAGLPPANPAHLLAGAMGGNLVLGWIGHLMIGVVLAFIYAVVSARLPGAPWVRGALFSVAPWIAAMLMVLPMMGMPVFGGSALAALGTLLVHLVYGVVLGGIYGQVAVAVARHAPA